MPQMAKILSLRRMLLYVLPGALACWGIGVWPTYKYFQRPGLEAQAWAFATALAVLLGSMAVIRAVVVRAEARNAGHTPLAFVIAQSFTVARMANILALAGVGLAVWYLLGLPLKPYFLWLIGFYVVMLIPETWWLSRTLKQFPSNAENSGSNVSG
jgi:hypothetical protein